MSDHPHPEAPVETTDVSSDAVSTRRGLVGLLGAVAAYAGFRSTEAKATASLTTSGASTTQFGLLASPGTSGAPIQPTIGATTHGVIGSNSSSATATLGSGVLGARNGAGLVGVLGVNASDGPGIAGFSDSAAGTFGQSTSGSGSYGESTSGPGSAGKSASGPGVFGQSTDGVGVRASSQNKFGLIAATASATVPALLAQGPTNGFAARFRGRVRVEGNFSVTGAKAAAVPLADGTLVTVYSQESPEPWFEDFGRARLTAGRAQVKIEPEFASLVTLDDYMVFLTPQGDTPGLYLHAQSKDGFEVRETGGGRGDFAFIYRIVARRRDIVGRRLDRIEPGDYTPLEDLVAELDPAMQSASWLTRSPGTRET